MSLKKRLAILETAHGCEIRAIRKEGELMRETTQQALSLSASETTRRLDLLNGEAARLKEMQATYLPRETFDMAHEALGKKIDELRGFMNYALGGIAVAILLVGWWLKK